MALLLNDFLLQGQPGLKRSTAFSYLTAIIFLEKLFLVKVIAAVIKKHHLACPIELVLDHAFHVH